MAPYEWPNRRLGAAVVNALASFNNSCISERYVLPYFTYDNYTCRVYPRYRRRAIHAYEHLKHRPRRLLYGFGAVLRHKRRLSSVVRARPRHRRQQQQQQDAAVRRTKFGIHHNWVSRSILERLYDINVLNEDANCDDGWVSGQDVDVPEDS